MQDPCSSKLVGWAAGRGDGDLDGLDVGPGALVAHGDEVLAQLLGDGGGLLRHHRVLVQAHDQGWGGARSHYWPGALEWSRKLYYGRLY